MFEEAVRAKAKARVAFAGPPSCGKTTSALKFAAGLADGGDIFVIDTEQGSSRLEVGKPDIPKFKVGTLNEPYEPKRYIEYIQGAAKAGASVVIVDSITHEWSGPGGILDMVDRLQVGGGNKMAAWRVATPLHNMFVDTLLTIPCHIIVTMRSKIEWDLGKDDRGRSQVKKVGMAPIQREGIEYEFTLCFDVDQDRHLSKASKDRTSLFVNQSPFLVTPDHGRLVLDWLNSGADVAEIPTVSISMGKPLSEAAINRLAIIAVEAGYPSLDAALAALGFDKSNLTLERATAFAAQLKQRSEEAAPEGK